MHFCTICEIIFLVGCPWKSNVVLEKSLKSPWKMVATFCMNPGYWFVHWSHSWTHWQCCLRVRIFILNRGNFFLFSDMGEIIHRGCFASDKKRVWWVFERLQKVRTCWSDFEMCRRIFFKRFQQKTNTALQRIYTDTLVWQTDLID